MSDNNKFDKNLSFTLKNHTCDGIHYILGNPHTFSGRVWSYCTKQEVSFYFSFDEVKDMSVEMKYWMKGYLMGNEPPPPKDSDGMTDFGSESYSFWEKSIQLFHETGYWNDEDRICELCNTKLLYSSCDEICLDCSSKDKKNS